MTGGKITSFPTEARSKKVQFKPQKRLPTSTYRTSASENAEPLKPQSQFEELQLIPNLQEMFPANVLQARKRRRIGVDDRGGPAMYGTTWSGGRGSHPRPRGPATIQEVAFSGDAM